MKLKMTTLIENMPDKENKLKFEHGFSVWIEVDDKKILFDTGQSGDFVKNAAALGIEVSEADYVVLSHGHYDHTGGVPALLNQLRKTTPFYLGKEFFSPKYKKLEDGSFKYNGNPFEQTLFEQQETLAELRYIEDSVVPISENIVLLKNFSSVSGFEERNPKFFIKKEKNYVPDDFVDEIALGIRMENGIVLVAGCSHVGIVNMMEHVHKVMKVPVAAVIGGTHLVEAGEERLRKTVEAFRRNELKTIAVSHCTGEAGIELLKKEFPQEFLLNTTGTVIQF